MVAAVAGLTSVMASCLPSHLSWVELGDREEVHVTGTSHLDMLVMTDMMEVLDMTDTMGRTLKRWSS